MMDVAAPWQKHATSTLRAVRESSGGPGGTAGMVAGAAFLAALGNIPSRLTAQLWALCAAGTAGG